jgi:NADPH:quinone reductase-like Zn-dependent oxidoreductase
VLVLGASGAVGYAAVEIAQSRGLAFSATRQASSDVNTARDPNPQAVDIFTEGKGLNVVIDTTGLPALMAAVVEKLALISGKGGAEIGIDLGDSYRDEKSIVGCSSLKAGPGEMGKEMRGLTKGFNSGKLKMPNVGG